MPSKKSFRLLLICCTRAACAKAPNVKGPQTTPTQSAAQVVTADDLAMQSGPMPAFMYLVEASTSARMTE